MILLHLLGGVALLIWGIGMVKTGMLQTAGGLLRRILTAATAGRGRAALAGVAAAAALQSSTATAMLLSAFVTRGMVALAPALAVMLGADLGSTVVVQVLAFDLSVLIPALIALGVGIAQMARREPLRQIGRMILGFGLMILALDLIVDASDPMRDSDVMLLVLGRLGGDPILALIVAAALTWLFHSSVAFVLFTMSLVASGAVALPLGVALVLGANLGVGLVPLGLSLGGAAAARRMLIGNLLFRGAGAIVALALLGPLVTLTSALPGDPARQLALVHTLFNVVLLLACLPLTGVSARVLQRAVPGDDPAQVVQPHRLDAALLDRPPLALNAATRELLGMADTIETMLGKIGAIFERAEEARIEEVRALEQSVDAAQEALHAYLVRLLREPLDADSHGRVVELLLFSTNLEHVGDIIDKGLLRSAQKKDRLGVDFSPEGWRDLRAYHARVLDQLRLALTVFVGRGLADARALVAQKDQLRELEAEATERHLERLREGTAQAIETSGIHLDILRDLKRVAAHLTSVAHPLLEERGVLRASRLKSGKKKADADAALAAEPSPAEAR